MDIPIIDKNEMKQTIHIKKIGLDKLDNTLHAQFHNEACDMVREVNAETSGVPTELTDEWHALANEELDLAVEARATVYTEEMRKKDTERTRTATFIFGIVRTMRLSPDAAQAEAARVMHCITREYVRIQKRSAQRRSADLISLIYDLKKPECAVHLERMGLTQAVNALEGLNKAYSQMGQQRTRERADWKGKHQPMIAVRRQSDAIYRRVVMLLQMAYLKATSDATRAAIEHLADLLSNHSAHINTVYKQSLAQRKAKATKQTEEEGINE